MSPGKVEVEALRKRILRKLDYRILPLLTLLWLVNFLDRTIVGNARQASRQVGQKHNLTLSLRVLGLEHDLHLHGSQFNVALVGFFASYLFVDIHYHPFPDNSKWLPRYIGLLDSAMRVLVKFIQLTVETGLIIYWIYHLIFFLAFKEDVYNYYHLVPATAPGLSKLYSDSLMMLLNARIRILNGLHVSFTTNDETL
ncbi:hypothetical protein D9758_009243 [Tetrapyrgos nigripes]|uniref:Uncharacterized protein n=1 Tax=Tetrapyrgos nigripes TaxID=182062 RepID=A0A8H5D2R9_9AGAR|nr:hypothetical protein D9758_009243 [Tetrapyrgos nigripes]